MKLQSQISREYKEHKYEKFWVVIPHKVIQALGWKTGHGLKVEAKGDKIVIEKEGE